MTGALHIADSLAGIEPCDVLITDPPYGERCQRGHDAAARSNIDGYARGDGTTRGPCERRAIQYPHWDRATVQAAVTAWHPRVRGWIVIMEDHILAREFEEALDAAGLYVFAPIPAVITGASVRLAGDGPSSWTRWITVARPRSRDGWKRGTKPGAYVGPSEAQPWIGGKPQWLCNALIEDYSNPGDLICDPCCGGGTTLVAAALLGRRWMGYDVDPAAIEMTRARLADVTTRRSDPRQAPLPGV